MSKPKGAYEDLVNSPVFRGFWRAALEKVRTREATWAQAARVASVDGKPFVCTSETARAYAATVITEELEAFLDEVRGMQEKTNDERSEQERGLELTEPGFDSV